MRLGTTRWLLVGLLCLGLWPMVAASDQETRWDSIMADAGKAYRQADYAEAEKLLLAALKEAEKFGDQDPRLANSLNNLAVLFGEEPSRLLLEVEEKKLAELLQLAREYRVEARQLGWTSTGEFRVHFNRQVVLEEVIATLREVWQAGLPQALQTVEPL